MICEFQKNGRARMEKTPIRPQVIPVQQKGENPDSKARRYHEWKDAHLQRERKPAGK